MYNSNKEFDDDEAWDYYSKVRDALNGLFEVLNIALDPNSIYYQCGVDNLNALKKNLIDLLMKDFDTHELQETLHRIEFNVKKSLFFKDDKDIEPQDEDDEETFI